MVGGKSCQASVSSQELEGEDDLLEQSPLFTTATLPICLPTRESVQLLLSHQGDSNLRYG